MKIKDVKNYEKWKANNTDCYGACIFRYLERWADLMEEKIEDGYSVSDVASKLSHKADTEGITGFMYGASVNILSQCWEHGEELRVWHNKQYEHTGDGVVNPAVMIID